MSHVLIIDDEIHAVRGLAAGVQWERLGIQNEHVHLAYSVKQGQEALQKYPISILICDIEMPHQTGMDMQEWVRTHYPDVLTIFLTCHADFSYVQRALQLGSFNYLLKPVDYRELEDVISSALTKYEEERSKQTYEKMYAHYRTLWESQQPVLAEKFWQGLLKQSFPSTIEIIREQQKRFGLEYATNARYVPTVLKVKRWHKVMDLRDEQIMKYAIRNVTVEGLSSFAKKVIAVPLEDFNGLVLLLKLDEHSQLNYEQLVKSSDEFIEFCKERLYCDICYYIGPEVEIDGLFSVVQRLFRFDKNNFVHMNKTFKLEDWVEQSVEIPKVPWAEWLKLMKTQDEPELQKQIQGYFTAIKQIKCHVNLKYAELFYQDFLQMIYNFLYQEGLEVSQVFDQKGLTSEYTEIITTIDKLQEWALYIVAIAMNRVHCLKKNMTVVDKAAQYIKEHIGIQELTREDIAKHVFLNPDYLTRIFKKETGMSISDYMQQCRINYAKKLLSETNSTVGEIAVTVGYSNISYFSTIFKKATHLNPIDYRKLSKNRSYQVNHG